MNAADLAASPDGPRHASAAAVPHSTSLMPAPISPLARTIPSPVIREEGIGGMAFHFSAGAPLQCRSC